METAKQKRTAAVREEEKKISRGGKNEREKSDKEDTSQTRFVAEVKDERTKHIQTGKCQLFSRR